MTRTFSILPVRRLCRTPILEVSKMLPQCLQWVGAFVNEFVDPLIHEFSSVLRKRRSCHVRHPGSIRRSSDSAA